jgi:RHS repeat-associated protein
MKKLLVTLGKLINTIVMVSLLASAILPVQNVRASQSQGEEASSESLRDSSSRLPLALEPAEKVKILVQEPNAPTKKGITLSLEAEPAMYIPGKPITLTWDIKGLSASQVSNALVIIQVPLLVTPVDQGIAIDENNIVTIPVDKKMTGSTSWDLSAVEEFPVSFGVELQVNGKVVDTNAATLTMAQYLAKKNQSEVLSGMSKVKQPKNNKMEGFGGKVQVSIPASSLNESVVVSIQDPSYNHQPGVSLTWQPVEIIAAEAISGKNVKEFKNPITIQMTYDEEDLKGNDELDLMLFYYDEATSDWYPLQTLVDTQANTLTAWSDHLTVFDWKAATWQKYALPSLDAFRVADFTGAGTYSYSFWTPPGPGGMQPSVQLTYNSQIIDESSAFSQASWVGMGWSLDTGAITRNMHSTNDNTADDTFQISTNGVSGLLLPISVNGSVTTYNTADQSFAKVEFNSGTNVWTVWTKDGTRLVFDKPARTNKTNGCVSSTSSLDITWRWSLGSMTDINNNTLTYSYTTETKSASCVNEIAVYPSTITYPNGKYRVRFGTGARTDYQTSWTANDNKVLFGRYRLTNVVIEHNPSGTWLPIRNYNFTYAPDSATTNVIYPRFTWSAGGKTLTLRSVQELNGDGSAALPAVTFTYDDLHLTGVNNSQGGSVQINYERWSYFDDPNKDIRSFYSIYGYRESEVYGGYTVFECVKYNGSDVFKIGTQWSGVTNPLYVRCDPGATLQQGYLQVGNGPISTGYHTIPEDLVKPGNQYRALVQGRKIGDSNAYAYGDFGVIDTSNGATNVFRYAIIKNGPGGVTMPPSEATIEMPSSFDPINTKMYISGELSYIRNIQFVQFPTFYRVASQTTTSQPTGTANTLTYHYDNASPTTAYISEAASQSSTLYTPILREFRGNSMSQVVNSEGLAKTSWFHQGDALKGRPHRELTMQQSFFDGMETLNLSNWVKSSAGTHVPSLLNYTSNNDYDFDNSIKSESTTADWSVSLSRAGNELSNGEMAVAMVRLSGASAQAEVGLSSSSGQFFGVVIQPEGGSHVARLRTHSGDGQVLIPAGSFKIDTWYVLMLFVDNNDGFRLQMWQETNPDVYAEAVQGGFGSSSWTFRERVNTGTLWLDNYFEGVPYSESTTKYGTVTQYDTVTGNGVPDIANASLLGFRDLSITWSYPTESIQRNYNGDAAWAGTRTTYEFNAADQNGLQFGNLTRQAEYGWNGSSWAAYRGTKTQFFPNTTAYRLSYPARQVSLACSASCDFAGESGLTSETLFLYDGNTGNYNVSPTTGRLTTRRTLARPGEYSQVSYGYDGYGNPTSATTYSSYGSSTANPAGAAQTTTTTYDSAGYNTYAVKAVNPLDMAVSTDYDYAKGLPTKITNAYRNGSAPSEAAWTAEYDAFGRTTKVFAPYGEQLLSVVYNDTTIPFRVDLAQRMDASHVYRLSRFYSGIGQLLQTQELEVELDSGIKNVVADYAYDSLGRLDKQTVPYEIASANPPVFVQDFSKPYSQTQYDVLGRTKRVTAPNGNQTNTSYADLSVTQTDPKGAATVTNFDVWGQVKEVLPPAGPSMTYTYDTLGRLKTAVKGSGGTATTVSMAYDLGGRKINMSDPDMGYWQYDYDALGNLKTQTDARGCMTTLNYDALNRLETKTYSGPLAQCDNTPDVSYGYDLGENALGLRTSMTDGSGFTTWTYDERGRMKSETKTIDGLPFTTFWTYTSSDNVETMTYPDGEVVTYQYNSRGQLTSVTGTEGTTTYLASANYDAASRLKNIKLGSNLLDRTYTYFDWGTSGKGGLLQTLVSQQAGGSQLTLQNLAYDYDPNGNITSITDARNTEVSSFGYDSLNRLTSAVISGAQPFSEDYTFDERGRLATRGGVTYTYDPSHPHAAASLSSGSNYTYDPNGNQISREIQLGNFDLTYDAENRMIQAQKTGQAQLPGASMVSLRQSKPLFVRAAAPMLQVTETPTPTPTFTDTPTPTATDTPVYTPTDTPVETPTFTPTDTPTATFTPTPTETLTPSPTATLITIPVGISISTRNNHTCALTSTGGVKCWGVNANGQLGDGTTTLRLTPVDVVGLTSGVVAVAAGDAHTCALTSTGGVKCWGSNANGRLGDGFTTQRTTPVNVTGLTSGVVAIAAGGSHTCALLNTGGVKCWGFNGNGRLGDGTTIEKKTPIDVVGLTGGVVGITAGGSHTCAVTGSGAVKCWGYNNQGQLGDNSQVQKTTPVDVIGLASGIARLAAGGSHTCALTSSGGVKCWGLNSNGQLGNGNTTRQLVPVDVSGLASGIIGISAGTSHTCAQTDSGGMKCWGLNSNGQLGNGTLTQRTTPVDVNNLTTFVTAIAAGGTHTCAFSSYDDIKCWGNNMNGQIGDGRIGYRTTPGDVIGLNDTAALSIAGGNHACALTTSGGVKCWGNNANGQLGDGTTTLRVSPVDVNGLTSDVFAIASGTAHTCALTSAGGVKCWGSNGSGRLGDGTSTQRTTPVNVTGLTSGVIAITAGDAHTCALTDVGGVKCWGNNGNGRLGDGFTTNRTTPVDVVGLSSGVIAIAAGGSHTCALLNTGGVKCWGNNANGRLGDGTTTEQKTPIDVVGLTSGVIAIAAGSSHTCALTSSGGVKCWGNNNQGQLGNNSTTQQLTPVDVSGLTSGMSAIAAGGTHSCALTDAGGVKCWGYNNYGQLGDGTLTRRLTPVNASGLTSGMTGLSTGGSHTCAVTSAGGLAKCWGYNYYGQVGNGDMGYRTAPVSVQWTPLPTETPVPTITPTESPTPTQTFTATPTFTNTPTPTPTPVQGLQNAAYTYDGDGKLVKAVEDGVTTLYVGAHYQINDGKVIKYYSSGTQMIAMRTNGELSYLLADHLGSTSMVTDLAGTVISEMRYTPYGETRVASGTSPTDYLYTSQRQEAGLGLYFYNARWYDPCIMQWTQPDTLIPELYNTADWNRYLYARGNPLKYSDPSGHWPELPPDYFQFIQGAITFFENMGYQVIGNPLTKSVYTNGADLVFKAKEGVEILAVELKDTASVNLGTLGKNTLGQYGGSIPQVVRSANRFVNSANTQLKMESDAIVTANKNGTISNALYTTASNVSDGARKIYNDVYEKMPKIPPPPVFIPTIPIMDLYFIPVPVCMTNGRCGPKMPWQREMIRD